MAAGGIETWRLPRSASSGFWIWLHGSKRLQVTTMSDREPTIDELFEDGRLIDEALRLAARDARRLHKALGNPMATWVDGQVVWVQPEQIDVDDDGRDASSQAEEQS